MTAPTPITRTRNVNGNETCAACIDGWVDLIGTKTIGGHTYSRGITACKWCELGGARWARHPELSTDYTGSDIDATIERRTAEAVQADPRMARRARRRARAGSHRRDAVARRRPRRSRIQAQSRRNGAAGRRLSRRSSRADSRACPPRRRSAVLMTKPKRDSQRQFRVDRDSPWLNRGIVAYCTICEQLALYAFVGEFPGNTDNGEIPAGIILEPHRSPRGRWMPYPNGRYGRTAIAGGHRPHRCPREAA